ncbi:hypothetical protein HanIR_Chr07g0306671 [Helianthus annuus]|nr:hypothetical protein HanIR_Chr07g0306671 [Helianthus annuus]
MLMESFIDSQPCCIFTSSVLISLWAFLSFFLQTPPLDLLAFLCSSVTSSGSLSDLHRFSGSISLAQTEVFRNRNLALYLQIQDQT